MSPGGWAAAKERSCITDAGVLSRHPSLNAETTRDDSFAPLIIGQSDASRSADPGTARPRDPANPAAAYVAFVDPRYEASTERTAGVSATSIAANRVATSASGEPEGAA